MKYTVNYQTVVEAESRKDAIAKVEHQLGSASLHLDSVWAEPTFGTDEEDRAYEAENV